MAGSLIKGNALRKSMAPAITGQASEKAVLVELKAGSLEFNL